MALEYIVFCTQPVPSPEDLARDAYGQEPEALGWFIDRPGSWNGVEIGGVIFDADEQLNRWQEEMAERFDTRAVMAITIRGGGSCDWDPAIFDVGHTLTDYGLGVLITNEAELVYRPVVADLGPDDRRPSQIPLAPVVDGLRQGKIEERLTLRDWSKKFSFTKSLADRLAAEDRKALGEAVVVAMEHSSSMEFPALLDAVVTLEYSEGYERIVALLDRRQWNDHKRRALPRLDAIRDKNRLDPDNDWSDVLVDLADNALEDPLEVQSSGGAS